MDDVHPVLARTRSGRPKHLFKDDSVLPFGNPARKWLTIPQYMKNMTLFELRQRQDLATNASTARPYKCLVQSLVEANDNTATAALLEKRFVKARAKADAKRAERGLFTVTESTKGDMATTGTEDKHENVVSHDGETSKKVSLGTTPTQLDVSSKEMHSLQDFFKRPVTIYDSTWADSTEYNVNLSVWDLWSKDAAIRAKLSNYSYFKGTLHVKVSFSGTPFHYGMVMCSYQPFPDCNYTLLAYDDLLVSTVPTSANILPNYKSYMSQAPGVQYISIRDNEPCEMEIPFFLPKQAARLWNDNNNLITNATSYEDLEVMGDLRLITINPFLCANEDFNNAVSVNVQAWCTDVSLSVITGTNIDITAEARRRRKKPAAIREEAREVRDIAEDIEDDAEDIQDEESGPWDEYTKDKPMYDTSQSWGQRISNTIDKAGDEYSSPGPIGHVASSISKAGEALSDVPIIGSFAKATGNIASKIGKVANWFGFSRPVIIEKTLRTKIEPYANGAHTMYFDTAKKITLDPKQELSIDQGLGGTGDEDCMAIKHITSRESFVHTFRWDRTATAMTTTLWETLITPMIFNTCPSASSKSIIQPTAMCWAAQAFGFWRGSITWRFEIVCSKFHRGKLMFKFEPNFSQAVLISSNSTKLNQQNTLIVDIQEVQNIEITIPFISDRAWKQVSSLPDNVPRCDVQGGNLDYTHSNLSFNQVVGWLQVRPLNELVQPTDDGDVAINCYVHSKDMEFAAPKRSYLASSQTYTETESGEIVKNNICQTVTDNDHIYEHHFGEKIESFRTLLKRYETNIALVEIAGGGGSRGFDVSHNIYPTTTNYPSSTTTFADTHGEPCLFNYLRYGYMGLRGGYRWRYIVTNSSDPGRLGTFTTRLTNADTTHYVDPSITEVAIIGNSTMEQTFSYIDGAVRHMTTLGGCEVEVPFYTNDLFNFAWAPRFGINEMGENILTTLWSNVNMAYTGKFSNADKFGLTCDTAAAEDFTFLRFQGASFRVEDT